MQTQELEHTTITVAKILPAQGRKSGKVMDTEGRYFDAWPNHLNALREGIRRFHHVNVVVVGPGLHY